MRLIPLGKLFSISFISLLVFYGQSFASRFDIVTAESKVSIFYDKECALDSIAANLLASDIENVSGYRPFTSEDITHARGNIIIIGSIGSKIMFEFYSKAFQEKLKGKWECYGYRVINDTQKNIKSALVICGSDFRGTAYGVFDLAARLGVSPWYWWADVTPVKQKNLSLDIEDYTSAPPSVKYRGIFINDEDWGLQPWAAKTFEPETGDIGPKTYAKVFELLLRLKANLVWPAMHPSTKAFFSYPGNLKVAEEYQIVVGTSHAEPMMRNNVGEWNEKTMGAFNYITNKQKIYNYWEERVKESSKLNSIYTLGMRGVHDSGLEGIKDPKEAVPLLERIFEDQRGMLARDLNKDLTAIPQVFTAYKEVLDIYDNNLKLPEDVTLVWPDDNYGYIQRLNTEKEKARPGGSGVYFHASYWGRPHDYLWLGSTHPSLIREEMMKAFENGANTLWVLNVGDIKPLEYNIQLFMDIAYDATPFQDSRYTQQHLLDWTSIVFGNVKAQKIQPLLWQYYQLAFERRPEFMGWSQTEPTTKTTVTSYNHFNYGDEAQQRINRYEELEKAVKALRKQFKRDEDEAFYQLIYYPVLGASLMNKKFLYRDKAYLYAKQNRLSAYYYANRSRACYDSIVAETAYFNEQLSKGKWNGIMSMKPRNLPVFLPPVLPPIAINKGGSWDAMPEGYDTAYYEQKHEKKLPAFVVGLNQSYFIDVFLTDSMVAEWKAKPSATWIRLSALEGRLLPNQNQTSSRLWVSVDWMKAPAAKQLDGFVEIAAKGKKIAIPVHAVRPAAKDFDTYKGFVENNGLVSIYASHYQRKEDKPKSKWQLTAGLGHTDASLQSIVETNDRDDTLTVQRESALVAYNFYSFSNEVPKLFVYTLPTHPLNKNLGMRYAVSLDDSPLKMIDFKTTNRSEEWKQNVLGNAAIREIEMPRLESGQHTLKIYAIDPGVVLDRMLIKFGHVPNCYGIIAETWKN